MAVLVLQVLQIVPSRAADGPVSSSAWTQPWIVKMIESVSNSPNKSHCGGVIVDPTLFVTAAHCFDPPPPGYGTSTFAVTAGPPGTGFVQTRKVTTWEQATVLGDSNRPNLDLAVAQVDAPFDFTSRVMPLSRLSPSEAWRVAKNAPVALAGFARTAQLRQWSGTLTTSCHDPGGYVYQNAICSNPANSLLGDSGGPVALSGYRAAVLAGIIWGVPTDPAASPGDWATNIASSTSQAWLDSALNKRLASQVTLYKDYDMKGASVTFSCAKPETFTLSTVNFANMASSIQVGRNCAATLSGSGGTTEYRFSDRGLNNEAPGNDGASVLKVAPVTDADITGVYLYTDTGFNGKRVKLNTPGTGETELPAGFSGVSSIRIQGVAGVRVFKADKTWRDVYYSEPDLTQASGALNPGLDGSWNDRITAVEPLFADSPR